jgi:hypothetical protein
LNEHRDDIDLLVLQLVRVASVKIASLPIGKRLPRPPVSLASYTASAARLQSWTVASMSNRLQECG